LRSSLLTGFSIPGRLEKLIVTLFADDTTVYLSDLDSFDNLEDTLAEWCNGSRAKFNITKTEIIPIGSTEYQNTVHHNHMIGPLSSKIPQNIHIVQDKECIRILGAWIGNKVSTHAPWNKVCKEIEDSLEHWGKSHPTIEGRRLIVQMTVAAKTQYLTSAQPMPDVITTKLEKMVHTFLWGDAQAGGINKQTMHSSHQRGGKKLVDIHARNDAIKLKTL
ncbi:hypothetical protein BDN71DRAFT_1361574, partial [Pleurotus eryngii]